jgi:hypothetical protein
MLIIKSSKASNGYKGSVTLSDEQVAKIDKEFNSKFEAFCYAADQNWTKAMIMKHVLGTTKDQYFYNYLGKYNAQKSQKVPTSTPATATPTSVPQVKPIEEPQVGLVKKS